MDSRAALLSYREYKTLLLFLYSLDLKRKVTKPFHNKVQSVVSTFPTNYNLHKDLIELLDLIIFSYIDQNHINNLHIKSNRINAFYVISIFTDQKSGYIKLNMKTTVRN